MCRCRHCFGLDLLIFHSHDLSIVLFFTIRNVNDSGTGCTISIHVFIFIVTGQEIETQGKACQDTWYSFWVVQ